MHRWREHTALKVALDTSAGVFDPAGTGTHVRNLTSALRQVMREQLVTIEFGRGRPLSGRRSARDRAANFLRDVWWSQHAVTRAARARGADLLHLPANVGPIWTSIPLVVTVHDVAVLRYPHLFRPWFRVYAKQVMPRVARLARAVITVSRSSKADIVNWLGVAESKVHVIHNGVDSAFRTPPGDDRTAEVTARYGLPREFALTVGSIEPRKNLDRLVQAVEMLREKAETANLVLVHVGPGGWLAEDVLPRTGHVSAKGAVRSLGHIPQSDLVALYKAAVLMVYPSLFEGFGLPVVEAMACGCPVVTSAESSLAEVAGDAAALVNPKSVGAIAKGISDVWTGADLRAGLRERGLVRSREFSWERAARSTVDVYEQVLAEA